jgi:hypothetical protein
MTDVLLWFVENEGYGLLGLISLKNLSGRPARFVMKWAGEGAICERN